MPRGRVFMELRRALRHRIFAIRTVGDVVAVEYIASFVLRYAHLLAGCDCDRALLEVHSKLRTGQRAEESGLSARACYSMALFWTNRCHPPATFGIRRLVQSEML